jgi:hypothetical protein
MGMFVNLATEEREVRLGSSRIELGKRVHYSLVLRAHASRPEDRYPPVPGRPEAAPRRLAACT